MYALSDLSKFEDAKEKYKILKPLWNVITDYLVVFLSVMPIVFAGIQVTSGSFQCLAAVDCPCISISNMSSSLSHIKYRKVCKAFYSSQKTNIIERTDVVTDLKSSVYYTNFVNSECSKSTIPAFLAYFWFVLFFQAFVLTVLNNLWLKLPNTASVIENFVSLVMECYASPFPNFVSTQTLSEDKRVRDHALDQQPDNNDIEMARLVSENNGNQPSGLDNILENPSRRHADGQQPDSNDIEMTRLFPENNGNQPHELDNISVNSSRRQADGQQPDSNHIETEIRLLPDSIEAARLPPDPPVLTVSIETAKHLPDNNGNQPHEFDNISENPSRRHADDQPRDTINDDQHHNFNTLEDPATISAVKTLYEKVHTFKENVVSSQKIWRLYLFQTILQASFAIASFVFDIYYMKDLKGTMTCTLTQHIPVAHDYFICSHNLAPTYVWGLKCVYLPTLAFALAIFIFTIAWTFKRRGTTEFEYDFEMKSLPSPVTDIMTDIPEVDKDFGFLLHLLHSYNKLYVVRFAHFLSENNKKEFHIFQAKRNDALKKLTFAAHEEPIYDVIPDLPCNDNCDESPYIVGFKRRASFP
jgi:hypothetical protein